MLRNIMKQQDGITLPTVIILFSVLMILSISALAMTENQRLMNQRYSESIDAIHLAEAGVNQYLWHLNKVDSEGIDLGEDLAFGDGVFRIDYIDGSVDSGRITIKSTGSLDDSTSSIRTIEAVFTKRSFTQYVWLTNTEGAVWNATGHTWNGPFHTNNILNITGTPVFNGPVSYVNGINLDNWQAEPNPVYNDGDPVQVGAITFPGTNSGLKARAISGGHYYNGMTAIFLRGDSYDVRTYVGGNSWEYNGVPYSFGSGADAKPVTASLSLPANGVIYIDGAGTTPWRRQTGDLYISGQLDGKLTIASANNIYITAYDPTDWREPVLLASGSNPRRQPQGAYTEGITYSSNSEDILGLIAEKDIEILNIYWPRHANNNNNSDQRWSLGSTNATRDVAAQNLELAGAYFALNGSVKYDQIGVDKGYANLFGAVIQNSRGAFASGSIGYGRIFAHDSKLMYQTPPYFLEPVDAGWELSEWREISDHVELITEE